MNLFKVLNGIWLNNFVLALLFVYEDWWRHNLAVICEIAYINIKIGFSENSKSTIVTFVLMSIYLHAIVNAQMSMEMDVHIKLSD